MLRTGMPTLGKTPLSCLRTVNHMNNTLFPVLLSTLLLLSACGGSSGVAVQASNGSDELLSDGNGDASEDTVDDSVDGGIAVTPDADPVEDSSSPVSPVAEEEVEQAVDVADAEPPREDAPPPILPPTPRNLSVSRYSDTAGELFWSAPEGSSENTAAMRYVVSLDGSELGRVSSMSFFTESLQPGREHTMSVSTLDQNGLLSIPANIPISAQIDIPPPVYEFDLSLEHARVTLQEGADPGARVSIRVAPQGNEAVNLSVQGQTPADSADISVGLERSVLQGDQLSAELTLSLPVGMRPIKSQERRFNVVATSGEVVRIAELVLDVQPLAAPDVYLLIGQSNMVGSSEAGAKEILPGGLDQRHERIWQLNVAPNNSRIFSSLADFQNESNTAIEPRFIEAEDPLHDPRNPVVPFKGGTTVGPILSFAKAALADTTQRIYLVPAAWGASGFCRVVGNELAWNAQNSDNVALGGTGLLERAMTRLSMTLRETGGVFRGILWHQGGADSNSRACADAYAQNLKLMVERIRREAPQDARGEAARGSKAPVPFIVATQSKGADERGDYSLWSSTKSQVDAVHRNVASLLPYADWVNNDDLVPPAYPCGSSSCVHFGATANRETGKRYYEALKRIWER